MPGAKTTKLINGISAPGISGTLYTQRARDSAGCFFVDCSGSGLNLLIRLQGRPDNDAGWYTIASVQETDLDGGTSGGQYAVVFELLPQMRVNVVQLSGTTPVLSTWICE